MIIGSRAAPFWTKTSTVRPLDTTAYVFQDPCSEISNYARFSPRHHAMTAVARGWQGGEDSCSDVVSLLVFSATVKKRRKEGRGNYGNEVILWSYFAWCYYWDSNRCGIGTEMGRNGCLSHNMGRQKHPIREPSPFVLLLAYRYSEWASPLATVPLKLFTSNIWLILTLKRSQ